MNPKIKEHILALIAENKVTYTSNPDGSESFNLVTGSLMDKRTVDISFFCHIPNKIFSLRIGSERIIDIWQQQSPQTILDAMILYSAFKKKYKSQNVDEVAIAHDREQKLIDQLAAARKSEKTPLATSEQTKDLPPAPQTTDTECGALKFLRNLRTKIAKQIKGYQK